MYGGEGGEGGGGLSINLENLVFGHVYTTCPSIFVCRSISTSFYSCSFTQAWQTCVLGRFLWCTPWFRGLAVFLRLFLVSSFIVTSTTPSHFGLATHCGQVGHSPCSHPCFRGLGVSFSQFGLLPLFLSLATVTDCLSGPFFLTLGVPMAPDFFSFFTGHQGFGWAGWVPMGCSLSFASVCASLPLFPTCCLRPLIPHMGPHLFVLSTAGYGLLCVFLLFFLFLHGSSQFCVGWAPWDFRNCF